MSVTRRAAVSRSLIGAAALPFVATASRAQDDNLFPLRGDDGQRVSNYRLPTELSIATPPGTVWTGPPEADVILVEFFDYNCPFCRKAAGDFDTVLANDRNFRLGVVNNAILSPGSAQAAKVQQAVVKLYGPKRAYEFHQKMFRHRGANDGQSALQIVKAMGLDAARVETAGNGGDIIEVVSRQRKLAADLGFAATPSFNFNGVGILGYPGPRSLRQMISAVRKCDKVMCG